MVVLPPLWRVLSSGMLTEAWVQKQGGWLSPIFKIYYRPMDGERGRMAALLRRVAAGAR